MDERVLAAFRLFASAMADAADGLDLLCEAIIDESEEENAQPGGEVPE